MKLKLYRIYLDLPGCGWEEIVKATNVRAAIKKACKKQGSGDFFGEVVGEKVPDDYLVKKAIVDGLVKERTERIDKIARDYMCGVTAILAEYKIKIDNV